MISWDILKTGTAADASAGPELVSGTAAPKAKLSNRARKAKLIRERKDAGKSAKKEELLREPPSQQEPRLAIHEDNEAMIQVAKLGSNPTMRHIGRVHGISVSFLHQEFSRKDTHLGHLDGKQMAADTHTHESLPGRAGCRVEYSTTTHMRLHA